MITRSRSRRSSRGMSIVEIMMALSLMTMVIIAFATVFPSGYRLNLANLNQSKAVGFANSVADELRALDMDALQTIQSSAIRPSVLKEGTSPFSRPVISTDVVIGSAPMGGYPADGRFYIADVAGDGGIRVETTSVGIGGIESVRTATITVTVCWAESRKRTTVQRSVTVMAMSTNAIRRSSRR